MFETLKAKLSAVVVDTLTTRFFLLFLFLLAIPLVSVIIFTSSLLASHLEETADAQLALSQHLFQNQLETLKEKLALIQQSLPTKLERNRSVYSQICPATPETACFAVDRVNRLVMLANRSAVPFTELASQEPYLNAVLSQPLNSGDSFFVRWHTQELYLFRKVAGPDQLDVYTGYPLTRRFLNRIYREQSNLRTMIWILAEPVNAKAPQWLAKSSEPEHLPTRTLLEQIGKMTNTNSMLVQQDEVPYQLLQSFLYSADDERIARVVHVLPLTANKILRTYFVGIYIIAVASLLFSVLLAMLAGRTITQPLLRLIQQVNTLSRENVMKGEVVVAGVHEIKQLGEAFNRMMSRLRQEYKIKDEFVATLTHDLKVPLIAEKQTLAYFSNKTYGEISEEQAEVLEVLQQSNKSCLSLVNGILEVYRYDSGEVSLILETFDLPRLMREIVTELMPLAKEKSITLDLRNGFEESGKAGMVHADRMEIKRVLHNLVSNAITNTPPHGKIRCSIQNAEHHGSDVVYKVSSFQMTTLKYPVKLNDRVLVCIEDSGVGFSSEDLPNLFKQFAGSRGRNPMSIGLGLYNCYQVIHAHNGALWVESTEGEGSVVSFVLAQSEETAHDRRRFGDRRKPFR